MCHCHFVFYVYTMHKSCMEYFIAIGNAYFSASYNPILSLRPPCALRDARSPAAQTMEILRRYCMGPDPVGFQIISDQSQCLRSVVSGRANYEDEFYSVSFRREAGGAVGGAIRPRRIRIGRGGSARSRSVSHDPRGIERRGSGALPPGGGKERT